VSADAGCRALNIDGLTTDDVFVAGDVARFPHPLYGYQFLSLEHWENAVAQARVVAHNMVCDPIRRVPHISVPAFWSIQFGVNIKSVGVPPYADEIQFTQGSKADHNPVAAYGRDGRVVAGGTVSFPLRCIAGGGVRRTMPNDPERRERIPNFQKKMKTGPSRRTERCQGRPGLAIFCVGRTQKLLGGQGDSSIPAPFGAKMSAKPSAPAAGCSTRWKWLSIRQ